MLSASSRSRSGAGDRAGDDQRASAALGGSRLSPVDWDAGRYERIATQLLPAARELVGRARLRPGERTLDVGCGTGSVALLAAEAGASVIAVDPARRLREVAGAAASERGLRVEFLAGEAGALPVPDSSQDVVLSSLGLIFAPDAAAAAAELARVTAQDARLLYTAWLPDGPIAETMGIRADALAAAAGDGSGPRPFDWHSADAVAELFERFGFSLELQPLTLRFTDACAESFLDAEIGAHPAWSTARITLERAGTFETVRERILCVLRDANEDPDAFCVSSPYVLARLIRA